jgi:glucosyl-3-phosphoglycerate synthase
VSAIRRYHYGEFPPDRLVRQKGRHRITVCVPARDEESTIAGVLTGVAETVSSGLVDEVLVVDDGSSDATAAVAAAAGARVIPATRHSEDRGWGPGKGGAMREGLAAATGDLVVYLDGDVTNFSPHYVYGLVGPMLQEPSLALVKAYYERPLQGRSEGGGRVTELTARPVIASLFPQLADLVQPLAGECAARREVLESVPFTHGYGVELGLLIDISQQYGTAALAQVDLGVRVHRNRSLQELSAQATAVLRAALDRNGATEATDHVVLSRPGGELVVVRTGVHPALAGVSAGRAPRERPERTA